MTTQKTRNNAYDFLKFVGLSAIILAHVGPPAIVMMIRSFDVPLMVILSALLAKDSYVRYISSRSRPYGYILFRAKRLVFPTWIFLTLFFLLLLIGGQNPKSIKYYLASYGLTRYGIGYVWVILIYLYVSILVPLYHNIRFSNINILVVGLVYIIYEICYYFQIGLNNKIIESTFYYIIPYGTIAFLGYNYTRIKPKGKAIILISSLIAFVVLMIYYWTVNSTPQLVSIAKYPPRLYYLGYGVFCSFALLMFCEKYSLGSFKIRLFEYVSKHSMWIYLWHIMWLTVYDVLRLPSVWYIKFQFVYVGAVLTVVIVNKCLDFVEKRVSISLFKYLRG